MTFVRLQHDVHGTSLTTLMHMLNHLTPQQTKIYMDKMDDDVVDAYKHVLRMTTNESVTKKSVMLATRLLENKIMLNYGRKSMPTAVDSAPSTVFAIVLINSDGFEPRGTGFLLNKPGYVATASHVVGRGGAPVGVVLNEIREIDDFQLATISGVRYFPAEIVAFDPIHDLAILYVPQLAVFTNPSLVISGADNISVGQDVMSYGFPHFDGTRKVLTRFDAKIGARILLPSPAHDVKYMVLNTLARPGQSGAPVFRAGTHELVAVLSGAYQPPDTGLTIMLAGANLSAMSQTTHIVSAEYLKGMY